MNHDNLVVQGRRDIKLLLDLAREGKLDRLKYEGESNCKITQILGCINSTIMTHVIVDGLATKQFKWTKS